MSVGLWNIHVQISVFIVGRENYMWIMLEDTDKLFWEYAYLWLTQKTNNRNKTHVAIHWFVKCLL